MLLHVRFLMEPFSTVLTRVRPGVGVDQQVGREGGTSLERFSTLITLKGKKTFCGQGKVTANIRVI